MLERIRSGDEKAMEHIYNKYREEFVGWSKDKYSAKHEDALDHYQDAITILFEKAMNGRLTEIESSLKTYLFGIGKNRIKQQFQKEGTRASHHTDVEEHYQFLASQESASMYDSAAEATSKLFNSLSDQCKRILNLFYFDKKSMSEIAEVMGFKSEAVSRTTKKRCLEKIREQATKEPENVR